jgi:hypothetical protein
MMQKVGVTDLPPRPLKESRPRDLYALEKKLWVVCSEFFLMLLGSFFFGVVNPLYFPHLDDLTASHSLCGIKNSNGPLTVN